MVITNDHDAELSAAEFMRSHGYPDAKALPVGTDAGIDVVSRHGVAQVKNWSKPVGRPALQNLKGSTLDDRDMLFFALSGYTTLAIIYARQVSMTLFRYRKDGTTWQVNDVPLPIHRTMYSRSWVILFQIILRVYDALYGKKSNASGRFNGRRNRGGTRRRYGRV